ncbi:MAG: hypothetical protein IJV31_10550 [Clostridia bacterium]|nr:hypothetical protein [Clostridia bacterium]
MKLEHLIQAYKKNNIEAELKDMSDGKEKAGTITFANGICAAYLLDDEEIVISMKIFFNSLARGSLKLDKQITHTERVLEVIQNTIMLLGNVTQHESNMILESLGFFDNTLTENKGIKHLCHTYRLEVLGSLLCLNINEIEE